MTVTSRAERRYELVVIAVAACAVLFRASQWRLGAPDLNPVAVVALILVPLAVRTQITISRGETDLTLGASAAVLFASDVERPATILPIWAVLVAISYLVFYRDETWGLFRAGIQIVGGAALLRVAQLTDVGFRPYDRVFVGLAAYFAVISLLELLRRVVAPSSDEGRVLRLRWTWTFVVGLGVFYVGCALTVMQRVEAGIGVPLVPSIVVVAVGLTAVVIGQAMRNRELNRSVAALSGAAVSMPWRSDLIDDTLGRWGARGLRVERVVVRERPGSRWDFSVPLADGRYVVARRTPGDLPFTQVEMHVVEALAHMSDTSRRESGQLDELRQRANTDGLTGLSTYTYFREVLDDVSANRAPGESIGIVFIDLDAFKEINDRYGHLAGDTAICKLANRLTSYAGDHSAVTRYGGDEFAVLLRDVADYGALTEECDRLTQLVTEPIIVGENTLRLRASVGAALSSRSDDNMEQIVRAADQQMYQRKRAVHAGDGEKSTHIDEAIREAIVDGLLSTAYQPIIELASDSVSALEVLVRYTDPELGSIPPPIIVESAIRLNMLDDLTTQVLDQAIATVLECRPHAPGMQMFTINLELEQMATWTPLLERIARCRGEHRIDVVVEISESSIGRWASSHAQVSRRLQQHGVLIAIDDFGSGYAGLGSLYLPQVDLVKLDRFLLTDLANPRQELVVTRVTAMLIELGFWVVAEGVTAPYEADILAQSGATHVQGYLYGMPLDRVTTVERFRRHGVTANVEMVPPSG